MTRFTEKVAVGTGGEAPHVAGGIGVWLLPS
jgi:hypothetical protein